MFTRKCLNILAFSKNVDFHEAVVIWADSCDNWIHLHKNLRLEIKVDPQRKWLPQTPGMTVGLTDDIWAVKELLLMVPAPDTENTN